MTEKLTGRTIIVPKGDIVNKDIVLVADDKYFSSLTVGGRIVGKVSVHQEQASPGRLCPTNIHIVISPGGSLTGDIAKADHVEISGEYSGDIVDAGIIKIHKGATVKGKLHCVFFYKGEDTEVEAQVTAQVCREL